MPISTEFDYDILLSLEKAKLVGRKRLTWLGASELILEYRGITNATKEDCMEWLEENRTSLVNPHFGFRTYEGTWYFIDSSYIDGRDALQQRFKIDGVFEDDIAGKSAGLTSYRSYYPKIVDPDAYNIPAVVDDGDVWSKRVQDNGDGTFDVVISKDTEVSLSGTSSVQAGPPDGEDYPGSYGEESVVTTSGAEQSFVADGGSVADAVVGEIKTIQNVPLDSGNYRVTVTTRTAIAQRVPPEVENPGSEYPWVDYDSDFQIGANSFIIGTNQTWAQFKIDRNRAGVGFPFTKVNSITCRPNPFGLFDYTIVSNLPG